MLSLVGRLRRSSTQRISDRGLSTSLNPQTLVHRVHIARSGAHLPHTTLSDMSADAEQIRVAARAVSRFAVDAQAAGVAVTGAGHTRWESLGAREFRDRLAERHREFNSRAGDLEELSRLLMSHAQHVETNQLALLKAALAVEKAAIAAAREAAELAGTIQHGASDAADYAAQSGRNLLTTMNPLKGLQSMGRVR